MHPTCTKSYVTRDTGIRASTWAALLLRAPGNDSADLDLDERQRFQGHGLVLRVLFAEGGDSRAVPCFGGVQKRRPPAELDKSQARPVLLIAVDQDLNVGIGGDVTDALKPFGRYPLGLFIKGDV